MPPTEQQPAPAVPLVVQREKLAQFGQYVASCLPKYVQLVQGELFNLFKILFKIFFKIIFSKSPINSSSKSAFTRLVFAR